MINNRCSFSLHLFLHLWSSSGRYGGEPNTPNISIGMFQFSQVWECMVKSLSTVRWKMQHYVVKKYDSMRLFAHRLYMYSRIKYLALTICLQKKSKTKTKPNQKTKTKIKTNQTNTKKPTQKYLWKHFLEQKKNICVLLILFSLPQFLKYK